MKTLAIVEIEGQRVRRVVGALSRGVIDRIVAHEADEITVKEAAALLRCSATFIRQVIGSGQLQAMCMAGGGENAEKHMHRIPRAALLLYVLRSRGATTYHDQLAALMMVIPYLSEADLEFIHEQTRARLAQMRANPAVREWIAAARGQQLFFPELKLETQVNEHG